ncbi:phosphomevalonate kinase [Streptococcus iniae]|nr:phosphomevalonate kinase [Streptococcus iniae]
MTSYTVSTGGKLYIAGEYAILKAGSKAIIIFIPIKMTASIVPSAQIELSSDMFSHKAGIESDSDYRLIQACVQTIALLRKQPLEALAPFSLTISGKMEKDGKKFGIGSSGSVTVLTLKALAAFYHLDLSADLLFKLATYTLLKQGDNGSMGDIACIAYEDLVLYQSFDREKIKAAINHLSFEELMSLDWEYAIHPIKRELPLHFLVGWTKVPAISKEMITKVEDKLTPLFCQETQLAVEECKEAIETNNKSLFVVALARISDLLSQLDSSIYHPKLHDLKEVAQNLGAIAKSSGAGGGDCGIAFAFSDDMAKAIQNEWQELEIETLYHDFWGKYDKSKK